MSVLNRSAIESPPAASGDAPREEDLSRCVHCGLCLMSCPTFVETGLEPESPRGRIYLIRAVQEGRIPMSDTVVEHLDLCLGCRNCESVCPSGVPYGRIIEGARAQIMEHSEERPRSYRLRAAALRALFPHPRRIRTLASLLRWYQASGLQSVIRRTGALRLLPRPLREMEELTPRVSRRAFRLKRGVARAGGTATARVAFFAGCIMPYTNAETQAATMRVLCRTGCDVTTPVEQVCCGALLVHNGDREAARRLARRNIDVFEASGDDFVVVNAAGCGSTLKEYGELLAGDPAYAERAELFAHLVKDVTELLAERPLGDRLGTLPLRVTYQDSCHLAHAQRVKDQPRRLLRAIPGLELVEMPNADRCCGSAGIYNIVQREMSAKLLTSKMEEVRQVAPDAIVTANPGCMIQLETGVRREGMHAEVLHVVDLLDRSFAAGETVADPTPLPTP
ncbi:MAG: (Fe-S)-binding protein, partial [Dehalococcoidia bacterium]